MSDGDLAFKSMKKFLREKRRTGEEFTIFELEKYVLEHAGTLRLAPGWWVRDYIEHSVESGRLIETAPLTYKVPLRT